MADPEATDPFDQYSEKQGWSALDNLVDQSTPNMPPEQLAAWEEKQQIEYELNSAIQRCYATPDGQLVWDFWRELATECQRFDVVNETDARLAAAKGFFREGQAAMYFEFRRRMREALKGPPAVKNT